MWRWWVLANVIGLYVAPMLARSTGVGIGRDELVTGGIFACFHCLVLAPRSLRVLWLIPIYVLLWDPAAVVFTYLIWRHGLDAAWELIIPVVDSGIWRWRTIVLAVLQWLVLWYAFRMSKWWIAASAGGWIVGQIVFFLLALLPVSLSYWIATLFLGLIYGCATGFVLDQYVFRRTQRNNALEAFA
jgi:hypothetical protein